MRGLIAGMILVSSACRAAAAVPVDEVPAAFAPFEHMVGGWKGTAAPTANRVKGWAESHGWAWKFASGKPVGMTVTFEGDKTLARGQLTFDEAARKYHLDGTDPAGKPVAFLGSLSADGKTLTLDRVGAAPEGKDRLIIRPNSNKIRYTLQLDRQEPGAPQYRSVIGVGLTKEGESFAAGGGGADLPKCILTGGAASMTVSFGGKSYPVCCTGCRDEFNDNPEKYAKKADLARPEPGKPAAKPAAVGKDDGSFDGLIDDPKPRPGNASPRAAPKGRAAPAPAEADAPSGDARAARSKDDPEAKAVRELRLGQGFEKSGRTATALEHYRNVTRDYPGSEAARAATARIKALGSR